MPCDYATVHNTIKIMPPETAISSSRFIHRSLLVQENKLVAIRIKKKKITQQCRSIFKKNPKYRRNENELVELFYYYSETYYLE